MSDTPSGGAKAAKAGKPERQKRARGPAGGAEIGSTRTYAYASIDEVQKVLRRAVSGFAKAGTPLDVRMEGSNLTLRLPAKEQQTDELRKLTRRLRPKGERGGKKKKGEAATDASATEGGGTAE